MTSTLPFSALTVVKINGRTKRVNDTPVGGWLAQRWLHDR